MEVKRLARCILAYIDKHRDMGAILFELMEVFSLDTRVCFDFLRQYTEETLVLTWPLQEERKVILLLIPVWDMRNYMPVCTSLLTCLEWVCSWLAIYVLGGGKSFSASTLLTPCCDSCTQLCLAQACRKPSHKNRWQYSSCVSVIKACPNCISDVGALAMLSFDV